MVLCFDKFGVVEYQGSGRLHKVASFTCTLLVVGRIGAQDNLRGAMINAAGDVAAIKQRAEAGDAKAQVMLGDALVSNFRSRDAFGWYQKAASQGNVEGAFHAGHLLLYGGRHS